MIIALLEYHKNIMRGFDPLVGSYLLDFKPCPDQNPNWVLFNVFGLCTDLGLDPVQTTKERSMQRRSGVGFLVGPNLLH